MPRNQPELSSFDDEIELSEVFDLFKRRFSWVAGGAFLGLALAAGVLLVKGAPVPRDRTRLTINLASSPCNFAKYRARVFENAYALSENCNDVLDSSLVRLKRLSDLSFEPINKQLEKEAKLEYDVSRQKLGEERRSPTSSTHIALTVLSSPAQSASVVAEVVKIQNKFKLLSFSDAGSADEKISHGADWLLIEGPRPAKNKPTISPLRAIFIGWFGGLFFGAVSGFIADRRSDRVFSQVELIRRLGFPLSLALPSESWDSPAVKVLVGQLATHLEPNLSWLVMSIAREHDAVVPFTQMLQQKSGADLQCNCVKPLLSTVFRFDPSDKPIGLLLVVQAGFNSARALEEARFQIQHMSAVQNVGVVLIGAPLPDELA